MERQRIGVLVLTMTIFYILSSAPAAFFYLSSFILVSASSYLNYVIGYGSVFISFFYCIVATSHSVICFALSSEYRQVVKKMLRIGKESSWTVSATTVRFHCFLKV